MIPDIGQGGCAALEDSVVLARCLAKALSEKTRSQKKKMKEKWMNIRGLKWGLRCERKWGSSELISTTYIIGFTRQINDKIMAFLRDKILATSLASLQLMKANFDCGKLRNS